VLLSLSVLFVFDVFPTMAQYEKLALPSPSVSNNVRASSVFPPPTLVSSQFQSTLTSPETLLFVPWSAYQVVALDGAGNTSTPASASQGQEAPARLGRKHRRRGGRRLPRAAR
jgi:hypothetical protein